MKGLEGRLEVSAKEDKTKSAKSIPESRLETQKKRSYKSSPNLDSTGRASEKFAVKGPTVKRRRFTGTRIKRGGFFSFSGNCSELRRERDVDRGV